MKHIATLEAYENKLGSFTGGIVNHQTKTRVQERFATFDEARNYVRKFAWDTFGPGKFALVGGQSKSYRANYWIA